MPSKQLLDIRRSITDADQIVSQPLDDYDDLRLLVRRLVLGNQDCLFRLDEETSISLISPTTRRRYDECMM
jgi:hypothetical protein